MNRNRRLLRTTFIYFLGSFATKLLVFILLPIYTKWLTPFQFGKIDLLLSIVPLIGPIFTLQITECIFRFLFDCKTEREKKINITNAIIIYFLGMIIFFISYLLFNIIYGIYFDKYFVIYFILLYLSIFIQQLTRSFQLNLVYSISSILSAMIQGIVNILLIKIFQEKALLIAPTLGFLLIILFGGARINILSYIDLTLIDKKIIYKQLKYSLPLIPNQICWWFNGAVGKYIVNYYLGTSLLGILAITTKFSGLLVTVMQIYFLAWTENSIFEYESKDRDEYFSNNLNGMIEFLLFFTAGFLQIIKLYFNFAIGLEYHTALKIIPIISIGILFSCIATFLGTIYTASKNTKDAFSTTVIAAITNIILSIILVKNYGLLGFAIANLCCYIIFVIVRFISIKKFCLIKLKFPNLKSLMSIILSFFIYYTSLKNVILTIWTLGIIGILFLWQYKLIILKLINKNGKI